MPVTIKQVEETMDFVFKKKRINLKEEQKLLLREYMDEFVSELRIIESRYKKLNCPNDQDIENQIKMIKALRMNNPLWDI